MTRRPKVGGVRKGAGRPPAERTRSVPRMVRLYPEEAAAQDAEAKRAGLDWVDWIREAAELAIARGSTR